jgi:hypothetical protein
MAESWTFKNVSAGVALAAITTVDMAGFNQF